MTYDEALKQATAKLLAAGIDDAGLDAFYLMEYHTGISRARFILDKYEKMPTASLAEYEQLVAKRAQHIPLQHITGTQDFMGLTFKVNEHVLIPRQDTETLVEQAMKVIPKNAYLLDLCTGSGCILISLLFHNKDAKGVAVDISEEALKVAGYNASNILPEKTYKFLQGDLFEAIKDIDDNKFDLIVSNPPYIPTDVIATLTPEVKAHEPMLALDGSADGLVFYRRICDDFSQYLKDGGYLMVEIGHDQGDAVKDLFEKAGLAQVEVVKDYCGNDRVVKGVYYV